MKQETSKDPQRAAYKEQAETGFDLAHAAKDIQVQKATAPQQSELLVEPKMSISALEHERAKIKRRFRSFSMHGAK